MKRRIAVLVTAAAVLAASSVHTQSPAERLKEMGILQGYEDGGFYLEKTLTRAEFVKMFSEAFLAGEEAAELSFSDIDSEHWCREYIAKAVSAEAISGFDDGTFRPDGNITYEQAAAIIMRYLGHYGTYPLDYACGAVEIGISDGVTALIGESLTRNGAVYMISNALDYLSEENQAENKSYIPVYGLTSGSADISAAGGTSSSLYVAEGDGGFGYYFNTEEYTANEENVFKNALMSPLSTFSIDTDTASYSNMRRYILNGSYPPNGSIRTEELINYFDYDNPLPSDKAPFSVTAEVAECPWNSGNQLAMISVQGDELTEKQPSNLVFLLDVSGSMYSSDKLPLVKKSLKMLINKLDENDTISIVTYASGTGVALESTPVSEKDKIIEAINSLRAGGATSGAAGLNLAYEQAEKSLIDGNNRIILCTDGDFNVGPSSTGELEKLITEKRDKGIFLTVLGFGMGNYKDNRMETLADKGNGNYAYIDSAREAKRVFVDELPKTLYTIAKDVKIQVEFNPEKVKEYRLVGYENRILNSEDFENDRKDAGELGSGSNVTVFYEIVPAADGAEASGLKYQTAVTTGSGELMNVKIRYKEPAGEESILREYAVDGEITDSPSENFKFAAAVAELGMILNDSEYKGTSDFDNVISLARDGLGDDKLGFRTEFLHLVDLLRYIE